MVLALAAMLVAQLVMVSVMTVAPLHVHESGQGLQEIGIVLSAHTLGMFALAPLSGWLTDRLGARVVILGGVALLAVSSLGVVGTAQASGPGFAGALFLLGFGWNLNFVSGSSLLTRELPGAAQVRAQGRVEALVWGASAVASPASTAAFAVGGYSLVVIAAGALLVVPLVVFTTERTRRNPAQNQPAIAGPGGHLDPAAEEHEALGDDVRVAHPEDQETPVAHQVEGHPR